MKTIKIDLLPKDFKESNFHDPSNCPLAKAAKRYFGKDVATCTEVLDVYLDEEEIVDDPNNSYSIINEFNWSDYEYVAEQYEKDPKAKKCIYYVELKKL